MYFKIVIFWIFITIILGSCDPAQLLIIRATEKNHTSVTLYANRKIISNYYGSENERIIIHIPDADTINKYKKVFFYRIGGWSNDTIKKYSGYIDSIIINNSSNKILLNNKKEIESYLMKHRHGFAKNILRIEAK